MCGRAVCSSAVILRVIRACHDSCDICVGDCQKFVEADPYVVHGLVTAWKIRDWTAVVGTGQVYSMNV